MNKHNENLNITKHSQNAPDREQCDCNYKDNYYGDQTCKEHNNLPSFSLLSANEYLSSLEVIARI